MPEPVNTDDRQELQAAKHLLENPGFAAKIVGQVGQPIEKVLAALPNGLNIENLTYNSLEYALDAALLTMEDTPNKDARNRLHQVTATATGAIGGAFGALGLAVELPISTAIMLRSIADVARSQGEFLSDPCTKKACMDVFAMGGTSKSDDASESGYYAVRKLLAKHIADAAGFLAKKSVSDRTAPVLVRYLTAVAARFGIQVTEKAAAQFVPAVGAVGGAMINWVFIEHFQSVAQGHFTVRRLERKYEPDIIETVYREL